MEPQQLEGRSLQRGLLMTIWNGVTGVQFECKKSYFRAPRNDALSLPIVLLSDTVWDNTVNTACLQNQLAGIVRKRLRGRGRPPEEQKGCWWPENLQMLALWDTELQIAIVSVPDMVAHALAMVLGRQRQADTHLWVPGHPGLYSNFQASQGYTATLWLQRTVWGMVGERLVLETKVLEKS